MRSIRAGCPDRIRPPRVSVLGSGFSESVGLASGHVIRFSMFPSLALTSAGRNIGSALNSTTLAMTLVLGSCAL